MADKGHFTIRSLRWTNNGAVAEDGRDAFDGPQVPDLDLRPGPRTPTQSGEFLVVPVRRRSADNVAAVRPTTTEPRRFEGSGTKLSTPPNGPALELDRQGPVSSRESSTLMGGVEIEELHWLASRLTSATMVVETRPAAPTIPKVQHAPPAGPRVEVRGRVVDRRIALAQLAGFGEPPTSLFDTPAYALRVLLRRRVLIRNLKHARRYRTHEATVYEEALSSANDSAVRAGIALSLGLGTLLAGVVYGLYVLL